METKIIDTTKMLYKGDEANIPRPISFISENNIGVTPHKLDIHRFLKHYQKENFYKELLRHAQS